MLSRERYDALVPPSWQIEALHPSARSAVVVASGGSSLWEAITRAGELSGRVSDPVDHHTRRTLARALESLESFGSESRAFFAFEQRGGHYADFVALGRAAGLGTPSRLGLLLHPVFGPWLSIRALILTPLELPESSVLPGFEPCRTCEAPCESACPSAAPGSGGFDLAACDRGRAAESTCQEACRARRACPVGAEHAYPQEAEAHHMRFR